MSREPNIPLLLWISTAMLAHLATGGGVDQVARLIEERSEIRSFARAVRERLQPPTVIELGFESDPMAASEPLSPQEPQDDSLPHPKKPDVKKDTAKPEKKDEPKKQAIVLPKVKPDPLPQAPAPPPQPPPQMDHRIAVKQNVTPNQEDNPTAKFIGDEANHVAEESVARITSHDQDDPNPTPGGRHNGPNGEPGNSDHDKVGESDDHSGDPTHAPGEKGHTPDLDRASKVPPSNTVATNSDPAEKPPQGREPGRPATSPTPAPPEPAPAPAAPNAVADNNGGYRLDPTRPGAETAPSPDPRRTLPPAEPTASSRIRMLGLGGAPTPGGVNLNLTPQAVVAAVGQDTLTRERQADGERRKSAHRGSWQASGFERWRSAIENYVASVKIGNSTALNTAHSPFGTYLVTIHNRIHPIFADDFLGSLDGLGANHPLNDPKLITALEIVVSRDDGHVVRMGVTKTSGITAFDIAALDSVQRASPFGKPPAAIVSPDGNVYFHWEFHRDPVYACSTSNARPFMLKAPPATDPEKPNRPGPSIPSGDPRENGAPTPPASREGFFIGPTTDQRPRRRAG
jgi:TonB C terminal